MSISARKVAALALAAMTLLASACGGGSSGVADAAASEDAVGAATPAPETEAAAPATAVPEPEPEVLERGGVDFRAVNLLDVPVDVYIRSTGLVQAELVTADLAPGEVSEFAAPPEGGSFLLTTAGAGDATCVATCDHILGILTAYVEEGPKHTVVLYDDEFSGPRVYDLWEQPTADSPASTALMPPAQSLAAIGVVSANAVRDADFGLRIATDTSMECLEPFNFDVLIGGNQTPAFLFFGATSFTLHDFDDRECTGDPVGGPFPFSGEPATRTHIVLSGSPGALDALQVEMTPGEIVDPPTNAADRGAVVELMAAELQVNFPLDDEQAGCLAALIVDGIGTEALFDGAALVDLESLPPATKDRAAAAFFESIPACDIDPMAFG